METEHYTRTDFSLQSDKVIFYNKKLKAGIIANDFYSVKSAIDNGCDLYKSTYWCYWYAMTHNDETHDYRYILEYLKHNDAITTGSDNPDEPLIVDIEIADCAA